MPKYAVIVIGEIEVEADNRIEAVKKAKKAYKGIDSLDPRTVETDFPDMEGPYSGGVEEL